MKQQKFVMRHLVVATGMAVAAMAMVPAAQADVTGNIGVYSKYVLRGITNLPENDNAAVQGGLDYSHSSGLYAGYWGSSLDYSNRTSEGSTSPKGFESDIYGGYKFDVGPVKLNLGAIYYAYTQITDADGVEGVIAAGIGPVTVGAKILASDVTWGNKGDTYLTVDYSQALPSDFTFAASFGYYVYNDDASDLIPVTAEESGFRHLNLGISHPLGKSGANMGITYIVGGMDRQGVDQENAVVLSLTTGF